MPFVNFNSDSSGSEAENGKIIFKKKNQETRKETRSAPVVSKRLYQPIPSPATHCQQVGWLNDATENEVTENDATENDATENDATEEEQTQFTSSNVGRHDDSPCMEEDSSTQREDTLETTKERVLNQTATSVNSLWSRSTSLSPSPSSKQNRNRQPAPFPQISPTRNENIPSKPSTNKPLLESSDSEEEIAHENLCPYCDREMPTNPSTKLQELLKELENKSTSAPRLSNSYGGKASLADFSIVCEQHVLETTLLSNTCSC
ncbi:hypothetical protein K435DRAFT_867968 [Dendrothele bispora CBS 962.96]|uniref:Uncharacterized protein n=1 Tax=Dendrothele bispora (strain CBS 962.96) TaxID=1314807 RepID=A0A4S8LCX4_DENBC|nr:hypothetical protein K435DRAFT_867968 [Dendrothele bispora CBS 962.96]